MENYNTSSRKITPCIRFNKNAVEAVKFYTSIFKNSKIGNITRYGKNELMPEGTVSTVKFQLDGQDFIALNSGPEFTFSEAISFIVNCDSQHEFDQLSMKLSNDGQIQQCGWLKDQFGVSWQIVPSVLDKMLQDKQKADRIMLAILKMKKIDIETLMEAYNG